VIRFLITYDIPRNAAAFDRHYREVHQPLTARLPGILSYTVNRTPRAVRGPAYHQVRGSHLAGLGRRRASLRLARGPRRSRRHGQPRRADPQLPLRGAGS